MSSLDAAIQEEIAMRSARANNNGVGDYYKVVVLHPVDKMKSRYTAEAIDIIETLDMDFAMGNLFKAVWRAAAKERGVGKDGTSLEYDLDKIIYFATLIKNRKPYV